VPNFNNGLAVAAGYLGLFSLLCLGPLLGIPALICGILALRRPELGGKFRAWFGIVTGGLTILATIVLLVAIVLAPK
jgi:hypothetical protein